GEQRDRAARAPAGALGDELAHRLAEIAGRLAEVVGAPEPRQRGPPRRAQQPALERGGQLVQIEVRHEQGVAELVLEVPFAAGEAAVAHRALVERAPHSDAPNGAQAARALRTPSSWKPHPQYAPQ